MLRWNGFSVRSVTFLIRKYGSLIIMKVKMEFVSCNVLLARNTCRRPGKVHMSRGGDRKREFMVRVISKMVRKVSHVKCQNFVHPYEAGQ